MTTTFEFASTPVFQPLNVNQAAASFPASRAASSVSSVTATPPDTAAFSASSVLSATSDASRSARIGALHQSIASGTYFVPAHAVAESIIAFLF